MDGVTTWLSIFLSTQSFYFIISKIDQIRMPIEVFIVFLDNCVFAQWKAQFIVHSIEITFFLQVFVNNVLDNNKTTKVKRQSRGNVESFGRGLGFAAAWTKAGWLYSSSWGVCSVLPLWIPWCPKIMHTWEAAICVRKHARLPAEISIARGSRLQLRLLHLHGTIMHCSCEGSASIHANGNSGAHLLLQYTSLLTVILQCKDCDWPWKLACKL